MTTGKGSNEVLRQPASPSRCGRQAGGESKSRRHDESGVALLMVVTWLALMVALMSEFTYGTTVDSAQAANARDELRAHYMARSAVSLSRLVIRIQQKFIEPVMGQAQQMLAQAGGGDLGISLRITDYAGPLMGFFGGSKDEVQSLGSLIGLDITGVKGLGMSAGRIDAEITSEDGKIDVNCGSGPSSIPNRQQRVYQMLMAMMYSPRYERLFSEPDADGQIIDRAEVARAIIDWADGDEQMFSPDPAASSGSGEDYRYDARKDPYKAHQNSYDTLEEIAQVRGARDGFLQAFQPYLTVYASDPRLQCRINMAAIKGDCTPLLMGIIRAAAVPDPSRPPSDPAVLDDTRLYPLAEILCERSSSAGFDSLDTVLGVLANPASAVSPDDPRAAVLQSMRPLTLNKADLERVAYVGAPRVYRIVATGEAGRVKKKITAILDTGRTVENPVTADPTTEKASGVLQYWREE